jgi:hypothetical protein
MAVHFFGIGERVRRLRWPAMAASAAGCLLGAAFLHSVSPALAPQAGSCMLLALSCCMGLRLSRTAAGRYSRSACLQMLLTGLGATVVFLLLHASAWPELLLSGLFGLLLGTLTGVLALMLDR